jgi:hypothetical protein
VLGGQVNGKLAWEKQATSRTAVKADGAPEGFRTLFRERLGAAAATCLDDEGGSGRPWRTAA